MKQIFLASLAIGTLAIVGCSGAEDRDANSDRAAADAAASSESGSDGTSTAEQADAEAEYARGDGIEEASEKGGKLTLELPDGVTKAMLGERTTQMIAVQVLLDRSRHSPGVIDGRGGGNTDRAIRYYREANGLAPGTQVDAELVRSLLETQGGDVFKTYTITDKDVSSSYRDVPEEFPDMAEMEELGYESPREMIAERFHMDEDFLAALNPDADFSKAGTKLVVVSRGDERLDAAIDRIEVRKGDSRVVGLDEAGEVVVSYPATVGSSEFPSPSGSMEVAAVAPEPNYTFDPDDQEWGPDKTFILPPGPNNPVGGTWIDLGKKGYGIHGAPDPAEIAKTASHGCVRLTNWDANELAKAVETGTPVVFT